MDSNCRMHGERIESINEKGEPQCRICFLVVQEIVSEYQGKKKTLLKKKQMEIQEKLRQSKKKMVEVQENLILKMKSHFEKLDNKRETLNGFFSDQEKKIEQYLDQQQDFVNFKNNNKLLNEKNDSTLQSVQEQLKNISVFEKEFQEILEKAKNDYINSITSIIQQQGQQQQQQITLPMQEQLAYKDFLQWSSSNAKFDQILFNRDNSILAHSDGFEIKFLRVSEEQLLKINSSIEDDDMELIQCIIFGQSNDDIYYGTDAGKLKIWKNQDEKWSTQQTIQAHEGKEIIDLKMTDNDSRLYSAGQDKLIKIWKKFNNNWIIVKTFDNKDFSTLCSIAIDTVSQKLISCSFTQIKIWNINDINSGYVLDGLEANKNNKVYFINDEMFFVTSSDKVYFYEKIDQDKFIQIQRNILPQNKKYNLPICYNSGLKIILLQNTENQNVEILRFNQGKFNHQSSIQGVYNSLSIASNAMHLVLVPKADTKSLKIMKLQ